MKEFRLGWIALVVRRRAITIGATFTLLALTLLGTVLVSPARFEASAVLRSEGGAVYPYAGVLQEALANEALVEQVAEAAGLEEGFGLGDLLVGEVSPAMRLDLRLEPLPSSEAPTSLRVLAQGRSKEQAIVAVETTCHRLLELDPLRDAQEAAVTSRVAPLVSDGGVTARARVRALSAEEAACRQQLDALIVVDASSLRERERELAARIEADQVSLSSHYAGLEALTEQVADLARRVDQEASLAYSEEQRELARRAERPREPAQSGAPPQVVVTQPSGRAGPTRLEQLELELQRMLARRQRRHPAVRALLREIETVRALEQRHAPSSTEPERSSSGDDPWERPIEAPGPGYVQPIAEGEPDAPGPVPLVWRQRAPSYRSLLAAQDAENEALRQVRMLEERLEASRKAHSALTDRLAALKPARAERLELERRLQSLAGELEEARRDAEAAERLGLPARPEPVHVGPPLVFAGDREERVTVRREQAGPIALGPGLLGAFLLALLAGFVAESRDRSFHRAEDVVDALGLPVLGVVPHLKGR